MAQRLTPWLALLFGVAVLTCTAAHAANIGALDMHPDGHGGQSFTVPVQVLLLMAGLVFLPAILLTMTSFTRIIIVLSLLRQALGLTQTPPNQVLIGLALFLTMFVMSPIVTRVSDDALRPLLDNQISTEDAVAKAETPLREFMLCVLADGATGSTFGPRARGEQSGQAGWRASQLAQAAFVDRFLSSFGLGLAQVRERTIRHNCRSSSHQCDSRSLRARKVADR